MSDTKLNVLIVEDDASLGPALVEALTRSGHHALLATRSTDAFSFISSHRIDYLVVDCLLPGMTGPDFIERVYEQYPAPTFKVILMSGIFTDRLFISDSTKRTRAISFLQKPFSPEELLKLLKKEAQPAAMVSSNARKKLYGIFSDPKANARKKRRVLEEIDEISGYDLPFIYSLLVETASSGNLFIYHQNQAVSGITFCKGNIVEVDIEDKNTYLGEMLIQSGYALPKDVQTALEQKRDRRIGQYMIQMNQLSPHAFDLILEEQMNLRLSKTISAEKVKINFSSTEVEMAFPNIDSEILLGFLHDWIASKIPLSWLKSLYASWSTNPLELGSSFKEDHPTMQMGLVTSVDGLIQEIREGATLSKMIHSKKYNEEALFKAVHLLLTRGMIVFAEKTGFKTPAEQLFALENIKTQIEGKTPFEVLQYVESSTMISGGSQELLQEFLKMLGEEPSEQHAEVRSVWLQVSRQVREALSSALDGGRKESLQAQTERAEAEKKLRANALVDEARGLLNLNQYPKALQLIQESFKLNPSGYQIRLYLAWAKLGLIDPARKAAQLKEVELEITQVAPDEKYDSLFPFVVGLFSKMRGDVNTAKRNFQKSLGVDSGFLPARRELSQLEAGVKQDILKMDLKDVVSGFFKKR